MARAPKVYTRLTRNAMGVARYSSLWLASDHLLIVTSTGYTEGYARVMLRDIKAFFVTPSDRRAWWNFVWLTMAAIGSIRAIAVLAIGDRPTASVVFFLLGALAGTWNTLLGAGCRVFVVTGVQTAPLPALVRLRKARAVLARLQPLIAAEQADLVAPAAAPVATETAAPGNATGAAPTGTPRPADQPATEASPTSPSPEAGPQ